MILNNKVKLLIISIISTFPLTTKAQDDRINVIKINPLSLFVTNISTFYERGLTPRSSVQFGINYMNANVIGIPISGFGATGEYRYHVRKKETKTPKGFYLAPWVRYQDFSLSLPVHFKDPAGNTQTITTTFSAAQSAVGGIVGYEFIAKGGFTGDFFIGPYYNYTSISLSENYSIFSFPLGSVPTTGIGLRSGIAFGYAF